MRRISMSAGSALTAAVLVLSLGSSAQAANAGSVTFQPLDGSPAWTVADPSGCFSFSKDVRVSSKSEWRPYVYHRANCAGVPDGWEGHIFTDVFKAGWSLYYPRENGDRPS